MADGKRLAALGIALAALAGIGFRFDASYAETGSAAIALWVMAGYFTIIANLLIVIVFGGIALGWRRVGTPAMIGGTTLAILLVGVVYALLLRGLETHSGSSAIANTLLHYVTPVLVPLYWLAAAPHGGLSMRDPVRWAALPVVYLVYAIARAELGGRFPYPFMDARALGWWWTMANVLAIAAGFLCVGALVAVLDGWLARRTARD